MFIHSTGGADALWNLVPACADCNHTMGNQMTVDEYILWRKGAGKRLYSGTPLVVSAVRRRELLKDWLQRRCALLVFCFVSVSCIEHMQFVHWT